jgi:hypothetical protein
MRGWKHIAFMSAVLAGCQTTSSPPVPVLLTYEPPNSCWLTVDGRKFPIWPEYEQSLPALKAIHSKSRRAWIMGPMTVPYKCVGAAIIVTQQAGFKRVGFISEPVPPTR